MQRRPARDGGQLPLPRLPAHERLGVHHRAVLPEGAGADHRRRPLLRRASGERQHVLARILLDVRLEPVRALDGLSASDRAAGRYARRSESLRAERQHLHRERAVLARVEPGSAALRARAGALRGRDGRRHEMDRTEEILAFWFGSLPTTAAELERRMIVWFGGAEPERSEERRVGKAGIAWR